VLSGLKEKSQRPPALTELFQAGQLVRGTILSLENQPKAGASNSKSGRKTINISLTVSKLNSALTIETIQSGTPTTACVTSMEDHGYTVSFGKGMKGFLSKRTQPNGGQGEGAKGLKPGMLVECVAPSSKGKPSRTIKVSAAPNAVAEAVTVDYDGLSIGKSMIRSKPPICTMTTPHFSQPMQASHQHDWITANTVLCMYAMQHRHYCRCTFVCCPLP